MIGDMLKLEAKIDDFCEIWEEAHLESEKAATKTDNKMRFLNKNGEF